jgi:hypothetical protein
MGLFFQPLPGVKPLNSAKLNRGQDIIMQVAPGLLFPDARSLCQIDVWCDIAQGDCWCRNWITDKKTHQN